MYSANDIYYRLETKRCLKILTEGVDHQRMRAHRSDNEFRCAPRNCYHRRMDDADLTYRDYARFAKQTLEEIAHDCEVSVFRATGPGGQGVNTTDSAVRMKHLPTDIVVTSRESRSQFRNRQLCLGKLRAIFERKAQPPKIRKKTHVPRRAKEKRLQDKRFTSEKKASRRTID